MGTEQSGSERKLSAAHLQLVGDPVDVHRRHAVQRPRHAVLRLRVRHLSDGVHDRSERPQGRQNRRLFRRRFRAKIVNHARDDRAGLRVHRLG